MKFFLLIVFTSLVSELVAQKYTLEMSEVRFYSKAPLEDIKASTSQSKSILNYENGEVVFSIPIESFEFRKDLMKEHFNENYMETEKFPKATLKATIDRWEPFEGQKEVTVSGELDIHGVQKEVTINGVMTVEDGKIEIDAIFYVDLEDYKIKIPKAVFYNIAETIQVTTHFEYKLMNQ